MAHRGNVFIHADVRFLLHLPEEVKHFYEMAAVRRFLASSIGVFMPAYIYAATGSVFDAILFALLGWGLFAVPIGFLNVLIARRWGIERLMYVGVLALVAEGTLAALLDINLPLIVVLAVLEALSFTTFWDAYHLAFGLFGRRGEQVSEAAGGVLLSSLIGIATPVLMGALISVVGYAHAYATVVLLGLALSTLLLRHFGKRKTVDVKIREVLRENERHVWTLSGIFLAGAGIVPLYVFVLSGSPLGLGAYVTALSLASALLALHAGKLADRGKSWIGSIGYAGSGVFLLSYAFLRDPLTVAVLDVVRQPIASLGIAFYGPLYEWARRRPARIYTRALWIRVGKTVMLASGLLGFPALFIVSGLAGVAFAYAFSRFAARLRGAS